MCYRCGVFDTTLVNDAFAILSKRKFTRADR